MKKQRKITFIIGAFLLSAFALWTVLIMFVDVNAIGPNSSSVGFSSLNQHFQNMIGTNLVLYDITDLLSIIPIASALGFAALGLIQWIKRKKLSKVDHDLFVLGGFYATVLGAYLLFEILSVNFRPILIEGVLEASYPSSTTMLVLCIMPTDAMQLWGRIKNKYIKIAAIALISIFTSFMLFGRIISGVHWITDIIGGALLSGGLVLFYYSFASSTKKT